MVYPGISADDLAPPPQPTPRPPTVGYLARICPEKGFDRLIDTMESVLSTPDLAHARLVTAGYVAGASPLATRLQQRIQLWDHPEAVRHLGEVDRQGKLAMLQSIDVLCVPTTYPEAKGIFVLEALACGVPFAGFDHGAFGELIEATGGGVLVPPGDVGALAAALADLLTDGPRRARLGRSGRAAVLERFTADHMAQRFLEIAQRAHG